MSALKSSYFDWLRFLQEEYPNIGKRIVVCLEQKPRRTEDGIDILPAARFCELLWALFLSIHWFSSGKKKVSG